MSFASRRASRTEMITSASGTASASASREPMWSACAWVRAMRATGAPSASAPARILAAEPPIMVSITVRPSSSATRYAFTKRSLLILVIAAISGRLSARSSPQTPSQATSQPQVEG